MKRTLSLLLALLMLAALAVPTFAAEQLGKNSTTIKTTIPGIAEKPVLDGFVDEFEYGEIAFTTDDMRIYGPDDAYINQIKGYDFAIHAAYSSDTVYLAVVVESPDYAQTQTDAANIWKDWSVQVSCAKADEKTAANRSELGFARNSKTNALLFNAWADAYKAEWKPDLTGKDFTVVTEDGVTTYEIALPAKVFGVSSLKKGDQIRLNVCMNVGTNDTKRGQLEWSQGTGGGKDATKFAVVTLGDAIEIPKAAEKTPAGSAATSDTAVIAALALVVSTAAVFVVSRKRTHA